LLVALAAEHNMVEGAALVVIVPLLLVNLQAAAVLLNLFLR
jgi:hypothetical protein